MMVFTIIYPGDLKTFYKFSVMAIIDNNYIDISDRCIRFLECVDFNSQWLDRWIYFYYLSNFKRFDTIIFDRNKLYQKGTINGKKVYFNCLKTALDL